jgi:hypothetical protein
MKMPGFTAEAAVYDGASLMYGMAGVMDAPAKGAVVVPEACFSVGPCRVCVTTQIFPPRACLSLTCFGRQLFNRCFGF